MPLKDILIDNPKILFVGINPGLRSEARGHHFAGNGNPFWRLLYASRLIPVEIDADNDTRLAEFGFALTNLCPRATRSAAELTADEIERGKRALLRKIRRVRPAIVAFVGISIYTQVFGRDATAGPGAKPQKIGEAGVFVLPNPSGLNAGYPGFNHKLVWFEHLRAELEKLNPETSIHLLANRSRLVILE